MHTILQRSGNSYTWRGQRADFAPKDTFDNQVKLLSFQTLQIHIWSSTAVLAASLPNPPSPQLSEKARSKMRFLASMLAFVPALTWVAISFLNA